MHPMSLRSTHYEHRKELFDLLQQRTRMGWAQIFRDLPGLPSRNSFKAASAGQKSLLRGIAFTRDFLLNPRWVKPKQQASKGQAWFIVVREEEHEEGKEILAKAFKEVEDGLRVDLL